MTVRRRDGVSRQAFASSLIDGAGREALERLTNGAASSVCNVLIDHHPIMRVVGDGRADHGVRDFDAIVEIFHEDDERSGRAIADFATHLGGMATAGAGHALSEQADIHGFAEVQTQEVGEVSDPELKLIVAFRKRNDLTLTDFAEYYAQRHLPYVGSVVGLSGRKLHRRNFILRGNPRSAPLRVIGLGEFEDGPDVFSEIFYERADEAVRSMERFFAPGNFDLIKGDEANFVMPGTVRFYAAEPVKPN